MKNTNKNQDLAIGIMLLLINIIFAGFLLFACNSCTPQRRLHRLITKHPYLVKNDTLIVRDTIQVNIPSIHIDTFALVEQLKDTVYFQKDFVTVKVWERNDTIFITAKTDTIFRTIYKTRKIPVEKIIHKRPRDWLRILAYFIICIFLGAFISNKIKL